MRGTIPSLPHMPSVKTQELNIYSYQSQGKRPLGRPRRRCEDNIIIDVREIG
jgi:hypothetical protein